MIWLIVNIDARLTDFTLKKNLLRKIKAKCFLDQHKKKVALPTPIKRNFLLIHRLLKFSRR